MRIGLIQTCTGIDPARNAADLAAAAGRLAGEGAEMIFTPEMCGLLDRNAERLRANVRSEDDDQTLRALGAVARAHKVPIAIGSLGIATPNGKIANRSFVLGTDGGIVARYDKLHLFDVDLPNGDRYRESASFEPGDHLQLVDLPWGRLGLTICYDVRFPALHAALALGGAQIIAQPAAFTVPTGEAHWHVLLRARAIETGTFIIAAAQAAQHEDGRETYGHSLVIDPWGRVLLDMGSSPGEAIVEIDLSQVADAHQRIPNLQHRKPLSDPLLAHAT